MQKRDALEILCFLSVLVAIYEAALFARGLEPSKPFASLWGFVFGALTSMWASADAHPNKPVAAFDSGLYFTFLWPVLLPYYLIKTRRWRSIPALLGFGLMCFGPYFAIGVVHILWVSRQ
jgi:hypothetical protein